MLSVNSLTALISLQATLTLPLDRRGNFMISIMNTEELRRSACEGLCSFISIHILLVEVRDAVDRISYIAHAQNIRRITMAGLCDTRHASRPSIHHASASNGTRWRTNARECACCELSNSLILPSFPSTTCTELHDPDTTLTYD